jgi:hypothetical protein
MGPDAGSIFSKIADMNNSLKRLAQDGSLDLPDETLCKLMPRSLGSTGTGSSCFWHLHRLPFSTVCEQKWSVLGNAKVKSTNHLDSQFTTA